MADWQVVASILKSAEFIPNLTMQVCQVLSEVTMTAVNRKVR